jgi:hypothetical protein
VIKRKNSSSGYGMFFGALGLGTKLKAQSLAVDAAKPLHWEAENNKSTYLGKVLIFLS